MYIPTALFAISVGNIIFAFTLTFTWGQNTISGKKKNKKLQVCTLKTQFSEPRFSEPQFSEILNLMSKHQLPFSYLILYPDRV